jgi:hypothetical protein
VHTPTVTPTVKHVFGPNPRSTSFILKIATALYIETLISMVGAVKPQDLKLHIIYLLFVIFIVAARKMQLSKFCLFCGTTF